MDMTRELPDGTLEGINIKTSKYQDGQHEIFALFYGYPESLNRFRCKICNGAGRFDDIPCSACDGKAYTVPLECLAEWDRIQRDIERRVQQHRTRLMNAAAKDFDLRHPPENPLCQAHPNVRRALEEQLFALAAEKRRSNRFVQTLHSLRNRFVSSAFTGWISWINPVAWSRKNTITSVLDQKKPTFPLEAAVEPPTPSGHFPPVTWPQLITCGIKGASPNTSDESSSQM